MSEKRCPLLIIAHHIGGIPYYPQVCVEGDCAWWNEDFDCCGLIAQGVIWGLEAAWKESHEDQDH